MMLMFAHVIDQGSNAARRCWWLFGLLFFQLCLQYSKPENTRVWLQMSALSLIYNALIIDLL